MENSYFRINIDSHYEFNIYSGLDLVSVSANSKGEEKITQKYIANFIFKVAVRVDVKSGNNTMPHVRGVIQFADGTESETITIPLNDIEKTNWSSDIDLRCLLNPDVSRADEHIANVIRLQCNDAPIEVETIIDSLGTHIIEGIPVYFAGNRLIWPRGLENKPSIKWEPLSNTRLAIDEGCSEKQAFIGMMRIVELSCESGRNLFSQMLLYIMRAAFVSAGIVPKVFVFLYGKTGFKKTTYAAFVTQLYNRDEPLEPLTRLNANVPAAVKLLYEKNDCVTVLDDLFPAQASDIHRQQEKTLLEITRVIGDGIEPARMRGQKVAKKPPKCGVLATGEYYIGVGSDGARHLPVNMTTPIDNDKMTACQNEPLMLSTYYYYFIKWYITNFDGIVDLIKVWLIASRNTKSGVHARLQETQFCLEAAFKLFLTYAEDKGFISRDESLEEYHSFYNQLRTIVLEQNARITQNPNSEPQKVDYLALIRTLYHNKRFSLADKAKHFDKIDHDGIVHGDYLYLRREKLLAKIRSLERNADLDEIYENLKTQQALKVGKGGNTRQIHGCNGNYRFVAIPLCKIK